MKLLLLLILVFIITISIISFLNVNNLNTTQDRPRTLKIHESIANDPLKDNLDGFPSKPLTIEGALLCDESLNIILPRAWLCKEDKTCKKCRRRYITRFNELKKKFTPSLEQITFTDFDQNLPILVVSVNKGQLHLLLNMFCSMKSIVDPKLFMLLVPTDFESYNILKKYKFNIITPNWVKYLHNSIDKNYNPQTANIGGHSDINNILLLTTNHVLQTQHRDIILSDVDIVWVNGGPLDYLTKSIERRDLLAMDSPYDHAQGGINTGFIYFNNNKRTRLFLQSVENLAPLKHHSDQILFNTILRHRKFVRFHSSILPTSHITRYSGTRNTKITPKTVLFHAVGINKVKNFKKYGFWFLNKTCVYYNIT